MDQEMTAIAARLSALRRVVGSATAAEFFQPLGMSAPQWSNYIAGIRRIGIDSAIRITEVYGVTLDFIYFGDLIGVPFDLAEKLRAELAKGTVVDKTALRDLRVAKRVAKRNGDTPAPDESPVTKKRSTKKPAP